MRPAIIIAGLLVLAAVFVFTEQEYRSVAGGVFMGLILGVFTRISLKAFLHPTQGRALKILLMLAKLPIIFGAVYLFLVVLGLYPGFFASGFSLALPVALFFALRPRGMPG